MADEFMKAALYGIKTFNKKAKEKIGMQKLIDLLNEYEPYIQKDGEIHDNIWYFVYKGGSAIFPKNVGESVIISKSYGFIKWLVENDKIDRDEIIVNSDFMPIAFDRKGEKYEWSEEKQLLMLLAIQDEPIRFLCEILK